MGNIPDPQHFCTVCSRGSRFVPKKIKLKGGGDQWPEVQWGGLMLENFIQSGTNLVQLFI